MKPGLSANKPLLAALVGVAMLACSSGSGSGGSQPAGGSSGSLSSATGEAESSSGAGSSAKGGASSSVGGSSSGGAGSSGGASAISSSSKPPEGGSTGGRSETGGATSTGGRTGSAGQGGGVTGGGSAATAGNVGGTGNTGGAGGTSGKGGQGGSASGATASAGSTAGSTYTGGRTASTRPIAFGTLLNAQAVIASAQALAKSDPSASQWQARGDQHRKYRNAETNVDEPFRLYVPTNWDGKAQLPLVMFLHGSGSNENSYIDSNNKQLITLSQEHGFILVGPLGATGAYGNFLRLSAPFGNQAAADQLMSQVTADSERTNQISEQDVINVLELVLNEYPVDRGAVFLAGHSMGSGGTWLIGGKYASYWTAIAPLSGPFVQEKGYPWDDLKSMPIFVTEGTQAPSLDGSHVLRDWLKKNNFKAEYKEVNADHGGMIPLVLPDIYDFFERSRAK